jgi:hypothetical protein
VPPGKYCIPEIVWNLRLFPANNINKLRKERENFMNSKSHRKGTRRRYRRIAAAVAGAAVLSSAMLPGLPAVRAYASPSHDNHRTNITSGQVDTSQAGDPVQIVEDNAATFGFDASSDHFSLLDQTGSHATVKVRSNGQTYKVDLNLRGGNWVITTIRGIGDSNNPATYIPASMFTSQIGVTTLAASTIAPVTLAASQQVLFQTDKYDTWLWNGAGYPQDMSFGILLQNPRLAGNSALVPGTILDQTATVDFGHQFALFAHLGTVAASGYGVGIAQVAQSGNDLIVVVRTKSPQPNEQPASTKTDDLVILDRSSITVGIPLHVTFVDQNGTVLATQTITPT